MKRKLFLSLLIAIGSWALIGCPTAEVPKQKPEKTEKTTAGETAKKPDKAAAGQEKSLPVKKAVAVLHPTEGNEVRGTVTFSREGQSIKVVADVEGLKAGKHGFHIHELGDCTAKDATSAGGHFNPEGKPHGGPDDKVRHVGDLGNLTADENGKAHYDRTDDVIALKGEHSIVGLAVIIHGGEDDLESQPTGDAGARLACGVVGIAER